MKHVSFALRICISAGAALIALAPRASLATSQVCSAPGMAVFERETGGISALQSWGTWERTLSGTEIQESMVVENLEECVDPDIWVSPDGAQLLVARQQGREILSVTRVGTTVTELPPGEKLWAADVTFLGPAQLAAIAALVYRDGEEPRLMIMKDSAPGAGELTVPLEVTGADCGTGTLAAGVFDTGEMAVLCEGSYTVFSSYDGSTSTVTFPLELPDVELVVAAAEPEVSSRLTFFAIVRDKTDEIDPVYDLALIRMDPYGDQYAEVVLEDVAYAGGDHGLAVIDEKNVVYMDEEGLRHVLGRASGEWSTSVIHPLRPDAKLSALSGPPRVLISEYDAELLTLTSEGWKHETLFELGVPPEWSEDGGSGCSMAGADTASGLGHMLLVMLALALGTASRLARGRGTAHDAACSSRASWLAGSSRR